MLYIENITDAQPLFVPRSRAGIVGDLVLKIRSTVGLDYPVVTKALDLNTSDLYYRIAVELPEGIPNGEYEYTLSDGSGTLSQGIVYVGGLLSPVQLDTPITYEQYEIN